jgi:hypothetical protein
MKKHHVLALVGWVCVIVASLVVLESNLAAQGMAAKSIVDPSPQLAESQASFKLAFTNPACAVQPQPWSRQISTIKAYAGLLFTGCGDYGANTGPIDIYSFNPATQSLAKEYTMQTEQIARYYIAGKNLYAVSLDPRAPNPVDFAYRGAKKPTWTGLGTLGLAHNFDIASLTGSDIWIAGGADNGNAIAVHSTDGGQTFVGEDELQLPPVPTVSGSGRFYFIGKLADKLYVQVPGSSHAWSFNGKSWEETAVDLLPVKYIPGQDFGDWGSRPLEYIDRMVYLSIAYNQGANRMYSFDGTTVTDIFSRYSGLYGKPIDIQVNNNSMYVLTTGSRQQILATTNLRTWRTVINIPTSIKPASFDILDNVIYLGAEDGKVYQASMAPSDF